MILRHVVISQKVGAFRAILLLSVAFPHCERTADIYSLVITINITLGTQGG
jgi:hypothetical protein